MSKLARHMAFYAAYHRHPHNKATHFVGVPMIVFSYLLALSYAQAEVGGFPVSAALVFMAVMTVYYMSLDAVIGLTVGVATLPLLWLAHQVTGMSAAAGWAIGLGTFLVGWAIQLLGHKFEGNRPALVSNIWQMFVAPLFLAAEAFFMLGLRKDVEAEVEELVARGVPGAAKPAHA